MDCKEEIIKYIGQQESCGALLLTGKWGSGKSYLLKEITGELNKGDKYAIAIVSLFGVDSIFSLNRSVKEAYLSAMLQFGESAVNVVKKGTGILQKLFDKNSKDTPISKGISSIFSIDIVNLIPVKNTVGKRKFILIFDDFERSKLDTVELFGAINDYLENKMIKAVIVANENEITEDKNYKQFKEKLVGRTLLIRTKFADIISSIILNYTETEKGYKSFLQENEEAIRNSFFESNSDNLRTVKAIVANFERVYPILCSAEVSPEICKKIFYNYAAICFENCAGTYDRDYFTKLFLFGLSDGAKGNDGKDSEKPKAYDKQYIGWDRKYQPESLIDWIVDGDWNEENFKKEIIDNYSPKEPLTPERKLLYGNVYDLTQAECEQGMNALLQYAYAGELSGDGYIMLIWLNDFFSTNNLSIHYDMDVNRIEEGVRIFEEKVKNGFKDSHGSRIFGNGQLDKMSSDMKNLYNRMIYISDHEDMWENRRQFLTYLNGGNMPDVYLGYLSYFDEELATAFIEKYKNSSNIERQALSKLLNRALSGDNQDAENNVKKETKENLISVRYAIEALISNEKDSIRRYCTQEQLKYIQQSIDNWSRKE